MTDRSFVESLVRLPDVVRRTGLSRPTIYRRMANGRFPRSVQLGVNSVAWRESDLQSWMREPMTWCAHLTQGRTAS